MESCRRSLKGRGKRKEGGECEEIALTENECIRDEA